MVGLTRKLLPVRPGLIIRLALCLALVLGQAHSTLAASGRSGWQPELVTQLGLKTHRTIREGAPIRTVRAKVSQPRILNRFGLSVCVGDPVELINQGGGIWLLRHLPTGEEVELRPFGVP